MATHATSHPDGLLKPLTTASLDNDRPTSPAPAGGTAPPTWYVHKFGGTSVATSECYRNAGGIILDEVQRSGAHERICVVISAMGEVKPNSFIHELIKKQHGKQGISPSALPQSPVKQDKVTNLLIKCVELAAAQNNTYLTVFDELKQRHIHVATELLSADPVDADNQAIQQESQRIQLSLKQALESDFNDFSFILRSVWLSRGYDVERAWYFGYGELWSARLFARYLDFLDFVRRHRKHSNSNSNNNAADGVEENGVSVDGNGDQHVSNNSTGAAAFLDARDVLVLAPNKDKIPDYPTSTSKMQTWLQSSVDASNAKIIVVTGYIASSHEGHPTTLGRDGSDYSASIFAALLRAEECTIWTDVDGVYSANPAQVKDAVIVESLSYDEASELAYFGAKVIHPKTMTPVVKFEIPIWIRNTFNSKHPGSCITSARKLHHLELHDAKHKHTAKIQHEFDDVTTPEGEQWCMSYGVKGVSEIRNLSLIKVEGTGLIGVPGIAHRLFGALRQGNCNVVLITQGGSEHSICFAVPYNQAVAGVDVVKREFRDELDVGDINDIDAHGPVACLAIVGDGMSGTRGVAGRFFASLADAGVNIVAIAQGSSERNISAIVSQAEVQKALEHAHNAFLRPKKRRHANGVIEGDSIDDSYSPLLKPHRPIAASALKASISAPQQPAPLNLSSPLQAAVEADLQRQRSIWCSYITLYVAVVVGSWETTLIHQLIYRLQAKWGERKHVRVKVVALINTQQRTMLLDDGTGDDRLSNSNSHDSLNHDHAEADVQEKLSATQQHYIADDGTLKAGVQSLDVDALGQCLLQRNTLNRDSYSIVIDCSESETIYRAYPKWTTQGIRVITQQRSGCLITDMDVMPLLETIHSINVSGDRILRIEAVLPSPLAFLFLQPQSKLAENLDFSRCEAVRSLTGIAWQLGYQVQPSDVLLQVDTLRQLSHPTDVHAEVNRLVAKAQQHNRVPRYVASIRLPDDNTSSSNPSNGHKPILSVGIREVSSTHPFYWLKGRNTMVIIHTHKLSPDPIILQAPVPYKAINTARGSNTNAAALEADGVPCNRASLSSVLAQFTALVSNLSS